MSMAILPKQAVVRSRVSSLATTSPSKKRLQAVERARADVGPGAAQIPLPMSPGYSRLKCCHGFKFFQARRYSPQISRKKVQKKQGTATKHERDVGPSAPRDFLSPPSHSQVRLWVHKRCVFRFPMGSVYRLWFGV